ncbi:HD-GYP domain-containing protein [Aromatoleum anaerobium]|uniref:HD domain-containing protein n=1 Tax=Aromatoleum anaerobium TaxID=182180 RepID=A0ABX1PU00_9RHOO|nr:HD-GYP domain-containing protein [Aromatoleum anaerobium]MCK0506478.1 HD-GYP domain-containing protein [Aromatoleum anaerobium]
MNDSRTSTTSAATCSCCGALIASRDRPETGDALCERCFLEPLAAECSACGDLNAGFAEALASALDLREHETGLHSRRVACHTVVLAKRFFPHDERRLTQIYWGALLHDIGKIGVPDRILLKNGPLDDDEWTVMRRHPDDGHHLVSHLAGMEDAAEIVRCHEERFDGTGYPRGLRGEAIPLGARLFAVIDALDAMTSDRPYRHALPFETAMAEIRRMSGSQFDPEAVRLFVAEEPALRRMVELKCSEADFGRTDRPSHRRT